MNASEGFLTGSQYLERVSERANQGADVHANLRLLSSLVGNEEDIARKTRGALAFGVSVEQGYEGLPVFVPLSVAKRFFESSFNIYNWHYDRTAGVLIANLSRGRHEHLSGLLYSLYSGITCDVEDGAEKFIEFGYGWFKSSASFGRMLIGGSVVLNAQERAVFSEFGRLNHDK